MSAECCTHKDHTWITRTKQDVHTIEGSRLPIIQAASASKKVTINILHNKTEEWTATHKLKHGTRLEWKTGGFQTKPSA